VTRDEPARAEHPVFMKRLRRWLRASSIAVASLVVMFSCMQLVPYGRTHDNPGKRIEPNWNTARTRELAKRACFDCHSNETRWPWYADVAPMSWIVQHDVEVARDVVNFSEWNRSFPAAPYSGHSIVTGGMPPYKYRMAHPEADLNEQEKLELMQGLELTLGSPTDLR
jgi:hypothetical protein